MVVTKGTGKSSSFMVTVILLLLIAITLMGILTAKRFFEAQATSPEDDTIKRLTEIANDSPDDLEARVRLAYAYQKQGRWDEASEIYQDVLKADEGNQAALYNLGVIAVDNKDYQDAQKRFEALLAKYPSHLLGLAALGELYVELKKPDLAIQTIDRALGYRPDIVDFRIIKAKAYEAKGLKDKAREEYKAVLKYVPDDPRATEGLAKLK